MNRRELFAGVGAAAVAAVLPKPAYTQSVFVGRAAPAGWSFTRASGAWAMPANGTIVFYPRALTDAELKAATS